MNMIRENYKFSLKSFGQLNLHLVIIEQVGTIRMNGFIGQWTGKTDGMHMSVLLKEKLLVPTFLKVS